MHINLWKKSDSRYRGKSESFVGESPISPGRQGPCTEPFKPKGNCSRTSVGLGVPACEDARAALVSTGVIVATVALAPRQPCPRSAVPCRRQRCPGGRNGSGKVFVSAPLRGSDQTQRAESPHGRKDSRSHPTGNPAQRFAGRPSPSELEAALRRLTQMQRLQPAVRIGPAGTEDCSPW